LGRADGGPGNSFVLSWLLNLTKEYLATENFDGIDRIKERAETIQTRVTGNVRWIKIVCLRKKVNYPRGLLS